jgi:hypothetical protein
MTKELSEPGFVTEALSKGLGFCEFCRTGDVGRTAINPGPPPGVGVGMCRGDVLRAVASHGAAWIGRLQPERRVAGADNVGCFIVNI